MDFLALMHAPTGRMRAFTELRERDSANWRYDDDDDDQGQRRTVLQDEIRTTPSSGSPTYHWRTRQN